jgi:SSS family solute:Na+ symporter
MNLHPIDAGIVIFYLVTVIVIGISMERRAGKNIESYFLGASKMPWWLLGMSGSSTYFDITGTMWMVSVFYVLGVRGLWEQGSGVFRSLAF